MKRIFWRVGLCFVVTLLIMTAISGLIFTKFNRYNVMNVYKEELKSLAQSVSKRITETMAHGGAEGVQEYLLAIDDFGVFQNTDIWILANPKAESPLEESYVNADMQSIVSKSDTNTKALIAAACEGKTRSFSDFDPIYEMDMMHLAAPIKNVQGENAGVILVNGEMDYRERSVGQYQRYMALSVIVALMVALIVSAFFSRQLVRPIIRIKEIALRMAAGEYAQQTGIQRKDELGLLAESMDILSEKLVEAEDFRENLEQSRRDFFSNVSHELRTPITVVKGYAETLADGYVDTPEKCQEYYERIRKECAGMERLVSDLLILSKMQNPDFELNLEILNVIAVMQDVLRSMRMMCAERSIVTNLEYDDECSLMEGDYDRIRQLFLILLQNAVKYANENTTIQVEIQRKKGRLQVSVEDTGIAIPKEEWENVFEKFYRGNNHGNKDGSGIGLVVAKHIVDRHHGKIWATSDLVEKTCFYIEFPECSEEAMNP